MTGIAERASSAETRRRFDRRTGIVIASATAVVSGVAVAINGYGVRAWADHGGAGAYTTTKNLIAAVVLLIGLGVLSARRSREGFTRPRARRQWVGLAAVAVVGGSAPFLLFFEGLARATSTNAAFIHKGLVVFVALLAVPLLGERLRSWHFLAIAVLVWGQAVLAGGVGGFDAGSGELMILAATVLWSIEVIIAKHLLSDLSPLTLGVARMGLGAVILVLYGLASGSFAAFGALGSDQIVWVLITGGILSLYVVGWYSSLARAQAVDVMAVLVGGALVTALVRTGFQGAELPSAAGLVLVAAGVAIVVVGALRTRTLGASS